MTVAQLKDIIKFLEGKGYECTLVEMLKNSYIFVDVAIDGKEIRLKCAFPVSFPYDFPRVYILDEFYSKMPPLPHIDNKGYICTFDRNVSYPNFDMPNEVTLCTIEKAVQIIKDGLSGTNRKDFLEEFNSYWGIENTLHIYVKGVFTPKSEPCILPYYKDKDLELYAAETDEQLIEYLKYVKGIEITSDSIEKCLFLPLNLEWYPPYPKTNKEIYLKVKEDSNCFKAYYDFMKNKADSKLIMFSQIINGNPCLAGWIQKSVKTPKGFRKGKILPELVYLGTCKDDNVAKVNVTQLNHNRLFYRGGDGNLILNDKVSVIGCGSIGSLIIRSLAELGNHNFVLIDNDILHSDNIARHYCGASDIGKSKVEAIKESLLKHYADIRCNAINKNVFDILENSIETINDCAFNFVVVGDRPIEAKFIRLINELKITKPVVLIWVEPYLLGGHAVIIQKPQDLESILYDVNNDFINRVIVDGSQYTKKEAGCQSTFIPYSAFESQQFIYSLLDYINNKFFIKNTDGNYLFSFCGNLDWARNENIIITDLWLAKDNRTSIIKRLD